MWSAVKQKGTVCTSLNMCTRLKCSVTKSCKFISRVKHHCWHTRSAAGTTVAAHVSMSDDKETGKLWRTCHKTVSRNCFGISVTPIVNRQNSSERLSASLVLASATLLIRAIRVGGLCLQPQKSHVQMTEPLQTSSACHSNGAGAVGTQMDVLVLSTSQEQSLDVLRFPRGCGGRDVLSFAW